MNYNRDNVYRNEIKYLVSSSDIEILKNRMRNLLYFDSHLHQEETYIVRSIYFDDYFNSCFYDNENGNDNRAKYRIRIYNCSNEFINLELKKKIRGLTQKETCRISYNKANRFIGRNLDEFYFDDDPLINRFYKDMLSNLLRPVVIVEYERTPFVFSNGNVRITFDRNISSSVDFNSFFKKRIVKRPTMPIGTHLLEVKFDSYFPSFIQEMLELNNLEQTAFSKYYYCRKFHI